MSSKKAKWEAVDAGENIFTSQYHVAGFISRSHAFRSQKGPWVIVSPSSQSPGELPPQVSGEAQAKDSAPYLVLPNAFHFLGLKAWRERFPEAQAFAPQGAMGRLLKKGCDNLKPMEALDQNLPAHVSSMDVAGLRWGESWFRLKLQDGIHWITGDIFFNYKRLSRRFLARTLQQCLQAGPGLQISATVKHVLIKNRKVFLKWIENQLVQDRPIRVLPLHGEVLQGPGLEQKISKVLHHRLGAKISF